MPIKLYFPVLIFLSGMIFYAAILHFTVEKSWGQRRVHLLFAAISLLMALFILSTALAFQAPTVNDFLRDLRLNILLYIFLLALFPWFFAEYTGVKPKAVLYGFTGAAILLLFVHLVQPYGLLYKEVNGISRITEPWGEEIVLPIVTASIWFYIGITAHFLVIAFGLYCLVMRFRQDRRRADLFMMIALALFTAGSVSGILFRLGMIHVPPPLGPIGYLGMIVVMALTLNYEIRENHKYLQAILDHVPAQIFIKDPQGRYKMINRHFEDLFHVTNAKMFGKTDNELFSKEQADSMHEDEQLTITTHAPLECEEIVKMDGEERSYFSIKFPLFHADGTPLAVCGITTDITKRKLSEAALKQSEAKYRRLYNETPIMLHSIDRDARVVDVNDYWLKTMGYERKEVIGKKVNDFYTEASRKYAQEVTQPAFFRDGFAKELSYQLVKKSGEVLDVLISATAERDASGKVIRSQAVIENVTERKRAETALRESEDRFRSLSNASLEGIMIHDQGVILDANTAFVRLFGYEQPEELIGRNGIEFMLTPDSRARIYQRLEREESGPLEVTGIRKDGTTFVGETDSQPIMYRGRAVRLVACRDITERKRFEADRRLSEERFSKIFEESPIGIAFLDQERRITRTNQRYRNFLGYSEEEIIERGPQGLLHPDDWKASMDLSTRLRSGEIPLFHMEQRYIRKDGHVVWSDTLITALRDHNGRLLHTIGWVQDITERKRDEEARARLTVAIEQAGETVVITDNEGKIQYVNPMFETVTGYSKSQAIGRNPRILKSGKHDPVFYHELWRTIRSGRVWHGRFINRKKDGSLFTEDATISPVHDNAGRIVNYVAVKRDISEQLRAAEDKNRLEEQLQQSQKMESIGTLAGGIAHDFNNILTAIIGYGNIALMKMAKDDPQRLNIDQMLDAANRAAHLTKDLLLFSRRQIGERKPIDLNDVIRRVETFLKRVIGEDIECRTTQSAGTLPVLGDAHQLEQVLMNLATNARDAMPKGGIFSISTEQVKCSGEPASAEGPGKSGNCALITISDTGSGMDEVTREHMFEPFFTTKEVGKGTGLGLAVVYGIIAQHRGAISVLSDPGRGTTFKISLPLIAEVEDEVKDDAAELMAGGTETVLLAEDDENVRDLTRTVLENFGYKVIVANDGQDAVDKYEEHREEIELLLLDIIMPKKTGQQAYAEIKALAPGIKVIFVSGYAPDEVRQRVLIDDGMPVVNKPISPRELLKQVREMLDRP